MNDCKRYTMLLGYLLPRAYKFKVLCKIVHIMNKEILRNVIVSYTPSHN